MTVPYTELHLKSFYSFGMGASHTHEMLAQAREYGYGALALTDTNLCGALEFARLAGSLDIRPITGGELTLTDGTRLVLLARTRRGYANLSRLFTLANAVDRREPRLDPVHLAHHSEGLVLLTGGREGPVARLLLDGRRGEAGALLKKYVEWIGPDSVYVELQRNFLEGDTGLVRDSVSLARELGVPAGRLQRRPLPRPRALSPSARPRRRPAQHHHGAGFFPHQAQPSPAPEVAIPDGRIVQ